MHATDTLQASSTLETRSLEVEIVARMASVGRSSMQVDVELIAEDLLSGDRRLCTRGNFTMIALDSDGRPVGVPALPGQGG